MNILILEDEILLALSIKKYLKSAGYNHDFHAQDYEEAVNLLSQEEFTLAILDVNISGSQTGIDVSRHMSVEFPNTAIIFVTSYSDNDTLKRIREVKPDGYLNKPIKEADLVMAVDLALSKSKNVKAKKVELQSGSNKIILNQEEFVYAKADHVYTVIFTTTKTHLIRISLTKLLQQLPSQFVRVNRSVIVNKDFIKKINTKSLKVGDKTFKISESLRSSFE